MNHLRAAWTLVACSLVLLGGCRSSPPAAAGSAAPPTSAEAYPRGAAATPEGEAPGRGSPAAGDEAPARSAAAPRVVELDGIRVRVDEGVVELDARACLDVGWLEQIACSPGTREHEALVAVPARPSEVHAALLLAGFENGRPGRWTYEQGEYAFVAPQGEELDVLVRYVDGDGREVTEPISRWIRDHLDRMPFPERPWIFGGSVIAANPAAMGPGEHYVADMTGSVIGLVTFGDEVIGFSEVIADEASVAAPQWVVATERVPPLGTDVTLVIRRAAAGTSLHGGTGRTEGAGR